MRLYWPERGRSMALCEEGEGKDVPTSFDAAIQGLDCGGRLSSAQTKGPSGAGPRGENGWFERCGGFAAYRFARSQAR
jgi:hypothetical protein